MGTGGRVRAKINVNAKHLSEDHESLENDLKGCVAF